MFVYLFTRCSSEAGETADRSSFPPTMMRHPPPLLLLRLTATGHMCHHPLAYITPLLHSLACKTPHTHPPPCQQDSLFPRNPSLAPQPPTHTTLESPQSLLPHSGEVATSCPGRKAERALHQTAAQVVLAWTSAVSRLPVPGAQLSGLLGPSTDPTCPLPTMV